MRFGFSRAIAFLSSIIGIGGGRPTKRSDIAARQNMRHLATPTEPVKHRQKTGGPNWLKMAINAQKHR